jgi:DNA-directed RNA polymerase specialized sigma subunit
LSVVDRTILEKEGAKPKSPDLAKQDFALWKEWKESDEDPDKFRPLYSQFQGLINSKANAWSRNIDLPPAVVNAEFNKQFLYAVRTYDPDKGAALNSWITTNLKQRVNRYLQTYQNPARIIETRTGHKKGIFDNAVATLSDQLDREPNTQELSEYLGWAESEVGRAQLENRKALYTSNSPIGMDKATQMPSRESEILTLIKPELSRDERLVYDYLIGDGGKPMLKPGEIAAKFGWNPSKVSHIKNSIANKAKKYM